MTIEYESKCIFTVGGYPVLHIGFILDNVSLSSVKFTNYDGFSNLNKVFQRKMSALDDYFGYSDDHGIIYIFSGNLSKSVYQVYNDGLEDVYQVYKTKKKNLFPRFYYTKGVYAGPNFWALGFLPYESYDERNLYQNFGIYPETFLW